jgi:hypothetical protein
MVSISESPPFELRSLPSLPSPLPSCPGLKPFSLCRFDGCGFYGVLVPRHTFYFGQNGSVFSHSFAHVFSVCSYSRSCIRLSLTSGLGYQIAHIGTGGTDWTACTGICWSRCRAADARRFGTSDTLWSQLRWSMWVWCLSDLVFYRSTPLPFIYMLPSQPSRTS